jgi:hypothetical protein
MYSIASILDALKSKEGIALEDDETLGCPLPDGSCHGNPDTCEKGNSQLCKQPVTVYYGYRKLIILFFRFKVSPGNRNGFIRKDDSSLVRLIEHNYINTSLLKSASWESVGL